MALDKKFKKVWLKALRSGKFTQTKGFLRVTPGQVKTRDNYPVGHCCLGVGEEVSPSVFPDLPVARSLERERMPTARILKTWGIGQEEADELSRMNDELDRDFLAIADYIEENL